MAWYVSPTWDAPLDVDAELAAIPPASTIKGMFSAAILAEAAKRGMRLPTPRERYQPFLAYPLVDHVRLAIEAARAFHPGVSLRRGVRRVGRAAIPAFTQSTIGRAVMKAEEDLPEQLARLSRAYEIAFDRPCMRVKSLVDRQAILRVVDLFLVDSHQIGVVEGLFKRCGVLVDVRVRVEARGTGELLCSW